MNAMQILAPFARYRAHRIARSLVEFLLPGQSVLDCGGGSMLVAKELESLARVRVFGTDVIPLCMSHPRFCLCPGDKLAFRGGSFDIVCLISVLHHTKNPMEVVGEALRVAKHRVIIHEDVFQNEFELNLLKSFDKASNDFISTEMSHPGNFKSEAEWRSIFRGLGVTLTAVRRVRPMPGRPSRHRLFVLDKKSPTAGV